MPLSKPCVRKAAILWAALDSDTADVVLRHLTPAQASMLRQASESLARVNSGERDEVIEEFLRMEQFVPASDKAGIELDAPLPTTVTMKSVASNSAHEEADATAPFHFLREASPKKLVAFLEREHPQTVAVVVSYLPTDRAAEVLSHLSGNLQIEVARRLVNLEETAPEIIREVERGLEAWLNASTHNQHRPGSGVSALTNILNAANPQARNNILSNLARHDRELAQQLDAPTSAPLSFTDLEHLDSTSLSVVLHHADREILVLALAGSAPQFADRAVELLGSEAFAVRQALRHLGPTRMSDVEEAQRQLAEVARQLESRGEISPDVRNRLSLAV